MSASRVKPEEYDLGRHVVVEASAGTGKTHTIERLVERLLLEKEIDLEKILVVTFTEKATGELKQRLRDSIERGARSGGKQAQLLKSAVDHFDQASIHTIHGFCTRILQDFALEQGYDLRPDLTDDMELLRSLLCEIQRKDWRRVFGSRLRHVLDAAGYTPKEANKWDRRILEIARKYKPRASHQIKPEPQPDWFQRLDQADATPAGQLEVYTIQLLRRRLAEYKRDRGLHSFDDMIGIVEENLDPAINSEAESLLQTLRERYRYGIVDEFQDTDPLQWNIFRRIFCEGGSSRLFVVGDPKQAIFSFRGADLPTYVRAAREMKTKFGAMQYALDVNFRSASDLLTGVNCIFGSGGWFELDEGIHYRDVHAADGDQQKMEVAFDRTDRAAVTLVDLTSIDRIKSAGKHFAKFAAYEIDRLLRSPSAPLFSFGRKSSDPKPLNAGDICILVTRRGSESEPITQALDAAGIPFTFYKQTGLWKSEEAFHLEVLLQTLANPDDRASFRKALLTFFFRIPASELAQVPDVPSHHPARRLFQSWLGYVEARQWSALFRSLIEDTGLLISQLSMSGEGAGRDAGNSRRVANLRQLFASLEQAGHAENLDLLGLLEWIRGCRQRRERDEIDMQPDEESRPKVKIMTIHAAKGLEFPIVFLAGGFTLPNANKDVFAYRNDALQLVFDLTPEGDASARVKADALAEYRRLFYVAMTRPMFKLYLPKVKVPPRSGGYLGPVGTVLLPALMRAHPETQPATVVDTVIPPLNLTVTRAASTNTERRPVDHSINLEGRLFPSYDSDFEQRRIVVRSFSSLARHHLANVAVESTFGDPSRLTVDETPAPTDQEDPLRGPVFGDMVHKVLEQIDFDEVGRAKSPEELYKPGARARSVLESVVKEGSPKLHARVPMEQLAQACRQQIAGLVWHALTTPLAAAGGRLCEIPLLDRRHEVDFLFPEHSGGVVPASVRDQDGFVTGFMDLLFRKHGRYFLLDWKTNLLPAYGRPEIERSMADSNYHRQYRLYLHAIRRWLSRAHGPEFSFLDRFGGVYYLYLRGMNGRDESTGVFFHRPSEIELNLETILSQ